MPRLTAICHEDLGLSDEALIDSDSSRVFFLRCLARLGFPLAQPAANIIRLEIQQRAKRNERAEPIGVVAKQPFFGFFEKRPPFAACRKEIFLEATDAVF